MWDSVQDMAKPVHALLAALKDRDLYTGEHSNRTTVLAGELGRRCGLTRHQLDLLQAAAAVHDIGKIGVPDSILLKPGRLDTDEWMLMKAHSEIGSDMLAALPLGEIDEVVSAVRHHHEGFDGKGYPDGLAGEAIPFMSRIITLADSYDAMATTRPYHKPRDHRSIMTLLHGEAVGHYDPWMLEKFTQLIETSSFRADRLSDHRR
jgi:HD-GYP domain-containing protein (c-di-GMP phosphodiesterase class II)